MNQLYATALTLVLAGILAAAAGLATTAAPRQPFASAATRGALPADDPTAPRNLLQHVAGSDRAELLDATWEWVAMTTPTEEVTVDAPERYVLEFQRDGNITVRADCNRGMGAYSLPGDDGIAFGPIALTRMGCAEGSLGDRFVDAISRATSYSLRNGDLFLELPGNDGLLRFRQGG
jgi:heat shock protein HslJ